VAFAPQSSGFFSPVAGTVSRIPADETETLVVKCVQGHLNESADIVGFGHAGVYVSESHFFLI